MRNSILTSLIILVAVVLISWTVPSARQKVDWAWTSHSNRIENYLSYLDSWPGGRHAQEAAQRIDQLLLEAVASASSISELELYLNMRPGGAYRSRVEAAIDSLQWKDATATPTIATIEQYLDNQPEGAHRADAVAELASLRNDESLYSDAVDQGTVAALESFLRDYPGHAMETVAQGVLRDYSEGRDIVDLMNEGRIEVKIEGNGITNVLLRIRRLGSYPVKVRVPTGSFFDAARASAQNMVSTAERELVLTTDDWERISVPASCANRPRHVPEGQDTFTVRRSPNQAELAKLTSVFDSAHLDIETRQAAVWIVTDNASYADLGILVASYNGVGGRRVINEREAARAMRTCVEAGIDITRKAIWRDRERILQGLEGGALKSWLSQKM